MGLFDVFKKKKKEYVSLPEPSYPARPMLPPTSYPIRASTSPPSRFETERGFGPREYESEFSRPIPPRPTSDFGELPGIPELSASERRDPDEILREILNEIRSLNSEIRRLRADFERGRY